MTLLVIRGMPVLMSWKFWNQWILFQSSQRMSWREAEAVPDAPSQEDLLGRVDLRQEVTFTIDGADARDLDDAVHIKRLPNGNFGTWCSYCRCVLLCH